jgi:hypothetical protein
LTGNGLPDFVELSDSGSLRVRQFETSGENMVSVADSITIDLPLQALESTVKVEELNGDVVSDIIVLRRQSIEIYMSTAKSDR